VKHEVTFKQTITAKVFVKASSEKEAQEKARKVGWKNGQLKVKYIIDDDAKVESVKCLDS
jgi:hypothetical protein